MNALSEKKKMLCCQVVSMESDLMEAEGKIAQEEVSARLRNAEICLNQEKQSIIQEHNIEVLTYKRSRL